MHASLFWQLNAMQNLHGFEIGLGLNALVAFCWACRVDMGGNEAALFRGTVGFGTGLLLGTFFSSSVA